MSHITLLIFTFVLNEEFRFLLKKVSLYEYSMSRIKIYESNQIKTKTTQKSKLLFMTNVLLHVSMLN